MRNDILEDLEDLAIRLNQLLAAAQRNAEKEKTIERTTRKMRRNAGDRFRRALRRKKIPIYSFDQL